MIKISISQLDKYKKNGSLDREAMNLIASAMLSGESFITIPQTKLDRYEAKYQKIISGKNDFETLRQLKAKAQGFEKNKLLIEAYGAYMELINFAASCNTLKRNNYSFDIERFRIVAKKLKLQDQYESFMSKLKFKN